jgi:hypothetical protein
MRAKSETYLYEQLTIVVLIHFTSQSKISLVTFRMPVPTPEPQAVGGAS